MLYGIAADAVVLLHLAFIVFVAAGGIAAWKWPKTAWLHLPAAAWGAAVEMTGWICPLTPLEIRLRSAAGHASRPGAFIDRYLTPLVYPEALSREMQIGLGILVVVINCAIYGALIFFKHRRRPGASKA